MSASSPRLRLPHLVSFREIAEESWNETLDHIDVLSDLCLLGRSVNTPPASPSDGDAYLVGGAPTGAWSGCAYKIAACLDGAWRFYAPFDGLRAFVAATGSFIVYANGAWVDFVATLSAIPNSALANSSVTIAGHTVALGGSQGLAAADLSNGAVGTGSVLLSSGLGVASGIATLDSSGKLTGSQLPSSVVGALQYQGTWNASTNTPTLASGAGTKGQYYKVAVAGTTAVDGISQWNLGDSIVFDGTVWDKIDGIANEVASVAGKTGVVTLASSDLTDAASLATLAGTQTLTNKTLSAPAISGGTIDGAAIGGTTAAAGKFTTLGVNATADSANKLAVASSAILFDNVGNGVQSKLNKHAAGDTASTLYQTGYSGRAEAGLCGDDNFHFKVSADGANWFDALDLRNSDGAVDFLTAESSLAGAATADLGSVATLRVQITGTTAITSFGTAANKLRFVRFAGALTLTHNAASLILLGGANRATAAGDCGIYESDGSGNWRERSYFRAAANPGDYATKSGAETLSGKTFSGATMFPGGSVVDASGNIGVGGTPSFPLDAFGTIRAKRLGGYKGSAYLFPSWGSANSWYEGMGFNAYFDQVAGKWTTEGDGSNNGGSVLVSTGGGGFLCYSFPSTGGTGQQIDNSSLSTYFAYGIAGTTGYFGVGTASPRDRLDVAGNVLPHVANSYNLGSATYYWANGYIQNAWTVISDAALKDEIAAPSAAETRVAVKLAPLIVTYKMKAAIAAKGVAAARKHCGWIAQQIEQAFREEGLDPFAYGCVGFDPAFKTVTRTRPAKDENGNAIEETYDQEEPDLDANGVQRQIHNIRYDEVIAFALAGLAARTAALETGIGG